MANDKSNILRKMGLINNSELIQYAVKNGIVIAGIIPEKCWSIHGCGSASTKLNS